MHVILGFSRLSRCGHPVVYALNLYISENIDIKYSG